MTGTRRSPYGANPALGPTGNRARQEMLDASWRLFTELGYHATSIEAVGEATGRSAAAVYQYFESKNDIFRVFVERVGADLVDHAGRLGPLRPGDAGRSELRTWIAGLSELVLAHATTYRLWAVVEDSEHTLRAPGVRFLEVFAAALRPAFAAADTGGLGPDAVAVAILPAIQWAQLTRQARTPEIPAERIDDELARVVHATLFPTGTAAPRVPPARPDRPPGGAVEELVGLRRDVNGRGRRTAQRFTDAAAVSFRRRGYLGTSVKEIAAEAGVGQASFYTYWEDREAVLRTLGHRTAGALERFPGPVTDLSGWASGWLDLVDAHGAVLHTWAQEPDADRWLGPVADRLRTDVLRIFDGLLPHPGTGAEPTTCRVAHVVQWALLTEFPYATACQLDLLARSDVLEVLALFLSRGWNDRGSGGAG